MQTGLPSTNLTDLTPLASQTADPDPFLIRLMGGNDRVTTAAQKDYIRSGHGDDVINSGAGDDNVKSGTGDDVVDAGAGNDFVNGGHGNDIITAGLGNDTIYGADGDDVIYGIRGNNILRGGDGADVIHSGKHASKLYGDAGDDHLIADLTFGADHVLWGGTGADTFEFVGLSESTESNLKVMDFELGVDVLMFDGETLESVANSLTLRGNSWKTFVDTTWGDTILFRRVSLDDFEAYLDDFIEPLAA